MRLIRSFYCYFFCFPFSSRYFLRTVSSVENQIDALLSVIMYHNWTTVILLYTDDFAFGRATRQIFTEKSVELEICIALARQFRIDSTPDELSDIGREIKYKILNITMRYFKIASSAACLHT